MNDDEQYIEVKAWTKKKIDSTMAKKIRDKGSVAGVITTSGITKPAKEVFDDADIAYVENFPEAELLNQEDQEEG